MEKGLSEQGRRTRDGEDVGREEGKEVLEEERERNDRGRGGGSGGR